MDVGSDAVFECKVNNLGDYKVVDTHNDQGDDGWLVVILVMLISRMMNDDAVDDHHSLHHR